ncbi:MAG: flagellar assembly peptidoglycan hydrolase FlgJ [Burkholderiales bacterium]|nr:flagellar assembly peptidoglycan hydrolase FlgJ [Burkholderiales bacterium]
MTTPLSNRILSQSADLAADHRSLDALRRDAQRNPQAAVKKAAQQFEALFMQMVLKSMRDASPKSGLFDSPGREMYTGMLDQQLASKVAQSGTGLAEVIARQLTRHMQTAGAGRQASGDGAAPPAAVPAAADRTEQLRAAYLPRRAVWMDDAGRAMPDVSAAASDAGRPRTDATQRNFVTRHWDSAQQASRITGIPTQFILGQAALESGWGRGEIRDGSGLPSHNLFGIKATGGWQGRTVDVVTTEYENGVPKKVVEKFRAYNNYSEAFRDWAQLMAGNPRYSEVLARGRDALGFAHGLQRAGYATDPRYGEKLASVIAGVEGALRRPS